MIEQIEEKIQIQGGLKSLYFATFLTEPFFNRILLNLHPLGHLIVIIKGQIKRLFMIYLAFPDDAPFLLGG